jgi:hypothetical protein
VSSYSGPLLSGLEDGEHSERRIFLQRGKGKEGVWHFALE